MKAGAGPALLALLVVAAAAMRAQSSEGADVGPLSYRLTLESLLEFDPSDPLVISTFVDRDLIQEADQAEAGAPWFPRSNLVFGFGTRSVSGAVGEEGERGWTGSPHRALLRMDLRCTPAVSAGVTCEKDPGERLDLGFLSAYLAVRGLPLSGEAIIGDYRLHAGCGLVAGRGPVRMEETLRRAGVGTPELAPHRSRDEFYFLRGLALRFSPAASGWIHCLLFSSRRSLSASGDEDAPSLSTNALFRTEGEIRRKGEISETVVGGRVLLKPGIVSAGVTVVQTWFSPGLIQGGARAPEGSCGFLSVDFSARPGPFSLSCEIARSHLGGVGAVILGALPVGGPGIVAIGVQVLSPHFASHRFAGVVTSSPSNQTAVQVSARYAFSSATQLRGHLCQHWTPSIGASKTSTSAGWSGSIGGSVGLADRWTLDWVLRLRRGDDERSFDTPEGGRQKRRVFTGRNSLRLSLQGRAGTLESLTTVEKVRCCGPSGAGVGGDGADGGGEQRGEQLRQEIVWKPARWLEITLTATIFSADSYAARTTSLEDDPISQLHFASLYGEGFRWGLTVRVKPPLPGLTVLGLLSASTPEGGVPSAAREWGVRTRWTW